MHILFSFSDNRIIWGHVYKDNSALTFHLDRAILLVYFQISERQVVAAIDFGTTYSSWGYSLRNDFLSDPGDIIVKRWEFGKTSMFKAPTCILLSPDGSKVEAFGFDAERMFAALVKQGRHRDYFFFFRFKLELQNLINKVSLSLQ